MVGTVIVAAVAIIFLPDVLDGEKQSYQAEFDKIPAAPVIDFKPEEKKFPQDKIDAVPSESITDEVALDDKQNNQENISKADSKIVNDSAEQKTIVTPIKRETIKTAPAKAQAGQAWVIQLGSFRHKKNVEELVNKLKKAGYAAFTKPIKTKSGTLTKVFVGPEVIKSSLEKKIPALKELTKVQGKVARFTPTK